MILLSRDTKWHKNAQSEHRTGARRDARCKLRYAAGIASNGDYIVRMLFPLVLIAACAPAPEPLPFFGDGYRADGDQCRRVGENDFTNQFLDDAADLVGCPEDMENLGVFAIDTGGIEVARSQGFVLYSVPVR